MCTGALPCMSVGPGIVTTSSCTSQNIPVISRNVKKFVYTILVSQWLSVDGAFYVPPVGNERTEKN
jgi:hypothetical protein